MADVVHRTVIAINATSLIPKAAVSHPSNTTTIACQSEADKHGRMTPHLTLIRTDELPKPPAPSLDERKRMCRKFDVTLANWDLLVEAGAVPAAAADKDGNLVWSLDRCEHRMQFVHYVYFIWDGECIKIGYTSDLRRRHSDLGVMTHRKLTVIHAIRGNKATEAFLHRKFDRIHVRGEWFAPVPELFDYIEELMK